MAELSVSRKNISTLFLETKKFVIPEFQRPYSWDTEKCDTLWADITNFHYETRQNANAEYFLGTIVSYKDGDTMRVIDGQQRITSFLLLLRAFYRKLEEIQAINPQDDEVDGLMKQIAPCIWDVNPMSRKVADKSLIHIESLVITEKDNDAFHHIMINGVVKDKDYSNYSTNYTYFFEKCNEYARNNPMDWKQLCLCILNQCIILPIECNDIDSALTIFSTLNDRGLELSDSDIFKAEMYKACHSDDDKKDFIEKWKELTEVVAKATISIDDVFRYYSHILRGRAKDKTKEIGLRKFYSKNKFELFKDSKVIDDLVDLAYFWDEILSIQDRESETFCFESAKKLIHCLRCYPNDYWRYPLSTFYYYHKEHGLDIRERLTPFLEKLVSYLFVKFIEYPSVNNIKDPVYQFCIDLAETGNADFSYVIEKENFSQLFLNTSNSKISRPIILLNSYLYDYNSKMIPVTFDVEHIFPQKWDTHYFTWTEEKAESYINQYGNKIPLEKKLNIMAGNGFFSTKKTKYRESGITEVQYLLDFDIWDRKEISDRTNEICERVIGFLIQNLMQTDAKGMDTKLLAYKGGATEETIFKLENNGITSYVLIQNEDGQLTSKTFSTYQDAFDSLSPGIVKFGTCVYKEATVE